MLNQLVDSEKPFVGASDIQETTLSLDGIARFVCNTFQEVLQAQAQGGWQFDAVVIGSGMYGSYAASKLYQFNRSSPPEHRPRVLVLEAGPFLITEHFQNLTRVGPFFDLVNQPAVDKNQSFLTQIGPEPGQPPQGMSPSQQCVGGKSLFWGGWSPRLTREDLGRKDENGNPLWPREVVEYLNSPDGYSFVEEQIGVTPTADFMQGAFNDALKDSAQAILVNGTVPSLTAVQDAPFAVQAQSLESGLFSMDKFSSLPLLLDSIRQDAESAGGINANRFLFLVPHAKVLKLETERGCVTQVVIALRELSRNPNQPGLEERVVRLNLKPGANVLLAGNTINSTRLALNSFPTPSALGPERMGKNLMAHSQGNYFWRINRKALGVPNDLRRFAPAALHIEGVTEVHQAGTPRKIGHFHFMFYAVGSPGSNPDEYLYRFVPHLEDIRRVQQAVESTNSNNWVVFGNRTCGEMFGNRQADPGQREGSFIAVNPFGGSGDDVYVENGNPLRIPKAFIRLVQTEEDRRVREAQTTAAFDLIAALSNESVEDVRNRKNTDRVEFIGGNEDPIGSTYHESGTLWMGDDPQSSVTDVHGRFHHVANAYCLDQALFPTVGSANPVLTGLALSQKIIRHLTDRYRSAPLQPIEDGFTPLFDGTLDGWQFFGAGSIRALPDLGIIEAGTAGIEDALGFLRYERKQYQHFILKLDWKAFSPNANSGVLLRMPMLTGEYLGSLYAQSIEVQIDETGRFFDPACGSEPVYGSSLHKTGALYNLAPATRRTAKAISPHGPEGYWNSFEIRVEGTAASVMLNGEPVSSATLPAHLLGTGYIALQCHSEVVQFRNIRIQELDAGK
jgi:hypothetical protein